MRSTAPDRAVEKAKSHSVRLGQVTRLVLPEIIVISLLVASVALPVWPGVHTVDSQALLRSATDGHISNWYAPIHGLLWGQTDQLGLPSGFVLVMTTATLSIAILAVHRLWLARTAALLVTTGTILWPPTYGMLGWVGRDNWHLSELMIVVALLGWAVRRRASRRTLLFGAVLVAIASFDARPNGIATIVTVAAISIWFALGRWTRWRAGASAGGAVIATVAAVLLVQGLQSLAVTERFYPEQPLYYYDLIGMSAITGDVLVPRDLYPSQDAVALVARRRQGYVYLDTTEEHPERLVLRPYADGASVTDELQHAWLRGIVEHPGAYTSVRLRLYRHQIGVLAPTSSTYYSWTDDVGWQGAMELQQAFPALNEARLEVLDVFAGPQGDGRIYHAPWIYLLAALLGAAWLGLRSRACRVFGSAMLLLLLLHQIVVAVASPAANYRYQLPTVVLGITLVTGAIATARHDRRGCSIVPIDEPAGDAARSAGTGQRCAAEPVEGLVAEAAGSPVDGPPARRRASRDPR